MATYEVLLFYIVFWLKYVSQNQTSGTKIFKKSTGMTASISFWKEASMFIL